MLKMRYRYFHLARRSKYNLFGYSVGVPKACNNDHKCIIPSYLSSRCLLQRRWRYSSHHSEYTSDPNKSLLVGACAIIGILAAPAAYYLFKNKTYCGREEKWNAIEDDQKHSFTRYPIRLLPAGLRSSLLHPSSQCAHEDGSDSAYTWPPFPGAQASSRGATWDDDWDFRTELNSSHEHGVTRTIVLVRHGQYVTSKDASQRILTDLGRRQAHITGERLKALGYKFENIFVSNMPRAMETGKIIADHLIGVPLTYDSSLQEGIPAIPVPSAESYNPKAHKVYVSAPRIEHAFRKYFYRADTNLKSLPESPAAKENSTQSMEVIASSTEASLLNDVKSRGSSENAIAGASNDSYELIIAHGNVIRYFICRVLQFPPEGWLRFALNNCSITVIKIRPNGRVSVVQVGDVVDRTRAMGPYYRKLSPLVRQTKGLEISRNFEPHLLPETEDLLS